MALMDDVKAICDRLAPLSLVVQDEISDAIAMDRYQEWFTQWFRHDLTSMRQLYGELFGPAIVSL